MKRVLLQLCILGLLSVIYVDSHAAVQPYNYNIETVGYLKLTNPPKSLGKIQISGNRLYTAANDFRAFDITNPAAPKELYTVKTGGSYLQNLWVVGNYAILPAFNKTFLVNLTQSNPTAQLYPVPAPVRAVSGNLLISPVLVQHRAVPPLYTGSVETYTTSYTTEVWDISNPPSPIKRATIDETADPYTLLGRYLVATQKRHIYPPVWNDPMNGPRVVDSGIIYDLSDPANPRVAATGPAPVGYDYIEGTRGYNVNSSVFDLSEPLKPRLIGQTVHAESAFWAFALNRTIGFVARNDELMAIDYTRPGTPDFILGQYRLTCVCSSLASTGNYIYSYDPINKMLVILRYTGTWPEPAQNAAIVKASSSVTVKAGQMATVSLTLRNSGAAAWAGDLGFKLAVVSDSADIVKASYDRICLPAGKTVAPGSSYTFSIPVLASRAGNYTFSVQMVQEFVTNFGPKVQTAVTATAGSSVSGWSGMN